MNDEKLIIMDLQASCRETDKVLTETREKLFSLFQRIDGGLKDLENIVGGPDQIPIDILIEVAKIQSRIDSFFSWQSEVKVV